MTECALHKNVTKYSNVGSGNPAVQTLGLRLLEG
jgi:hypothetical protein